MAAYMPKTEVMDRGWTKRLIERFLGQPDIIHPNPHYRTAGPMKLFLFERVKSIEESVEFKAAQGKTHFRRKNLPRTAISHG